MIAAKYNRKACLMAAMIYSSLALTSIVCACRSASNDEMETAPFERNSSSIESDAQTNGFDASIGFETINFDRLQTIKYCEGLPKAQQDSCLAKVPYDGNWGAPPPPNVSR